MRASGRFALAALFGGATGIGFAPVLVRLSETGPTATAFYRLLFALPWLWAWMEIDRSQRAAAPPRLVRREVLLLVSAGILFTADLSIWHWSLQFTTVANSTLITNVAPLFVTVGAWLLLGESIRRRFVVGMVLAMSGAALLAGTSYSVSPRHLLGDGLAVLAAAFYAGYLLALKQLRLTLPTPVIMSWVGLTSCLGFGLVAWATGDVMAAATPRGWLVLAALALISHVGGQTLIVYGFGHLPASFSSVTLLWQPVVAAVVAWMVLGEAVRIGQGVGALVVLGGIAVASGRAAESEQVRRSGLG